MELVNSTTIYRRGANGAGTHPLDVAIAALDTEGGQVMLQIGRHTDIILLHDVGDLEAIATMITELVQELREIS